jgi:hypothetical protein
MWSLMYGSSTVKACRLGIKDLTAHWTNAKMVCMVSLWFIWCLELYNLVLSPGSLSAPTKALRQHHFWSNGNRFGPPDRKPGLACSSITYQKSFYLYGKKYDSSTVMAGRLGIKDLQWFLWSLYGLFGI